MSPTIGSLDAGVLADITPTPEQVVRARARLHRKAVVIGVLVVVSYWTLVIAPAPLLVRLGAALALVVGLVAVATGIMHDANHRSFARSPRVNRVAALTADLLGASSSIWRYSHNNLHHANTNVVGVDPDIDQSPFGRLTPDQPWRRWHRYQHVYMWFLYGFLALRWFLIADFVALAQRTRHPGATLSRRRQAVGVGIGKLVHFSWALAVPFLFHRWWVVLTFYLVCSWLIGFVLAMVFQLAHCNDRVSFLPTDTARRGADFVTAQLMTTADVRCDTAVVGPAFAWLAGGLQFQIEHHIAPRLPHTIYASVARRLRDACAVRGLPYHVHSSIGAAIASHARWLRAMGRQPVVLVPLAAAA